VTFLNPLSNIYDMNIELAPIEYMKAMSWDEAKLYCFLLNIDGKIGWRLPTMRELHWLGSMELITSKQHGDPRKYPRYWSSDEHSDYVDCAWIAMPLQVDMHTTWDDKYVNTTLVRPVRDC
jgi:hypothetical protein